MSEKNLKLVNENIESDEKIKNKTLNDAFNEKIVIDLKDTGFKDADDFIRSIRKGKSPEASAKLEAFKKEARARYGNKNFYNKSKEEE
ncbi:hypothetical protein [uncultured Clostridium sp.]|uniref:hypothetical protein n=1 Tax=uncultured Clostridium sp. TaxID=59620 RepID=UPI002590D9C3|nr:hypothetical protein [uncultured Clostridium sp.]